MLLFIPLSFAGSPPGCDGLGKYLEGFEKDLHKKSISECNPESYKTLLKDVPVKDPEFLNGKVCSPLATIETELETAKLELAVLNGIEKLKLTVAEAKEKAEGPNAVTARVAGMTFVASLNTAQSLEVLLATQNEGAPFIKLLKDAPKEEGSDQIDLSKRLEKLCKDRPKKEKDVCDTAVFKPGPEAATEIMNLIKTSDPTPDAIASWNKMLEIKKKNPAEGEDPKYSFNSMQTSLSEAFERIDKKEVMTKDHIKAIASLDDFESAKGFSFIEDLVDVKNQKKVKIQSDKFFLLMGDAKLRQQYEAQSKMSVIWDDVKETVPGLTASEIADCSNAKSIFSLVEACANTLARVLPTYNNDMARKAKLTSFLPALRASVLYAKTLEERELACREEIRSTDKLTEACYADFNRDLATAQDKILQLNRVKDKIASENMELIKFRNFALEKWGQNKNCGSVAAPLEFCEDPLVISQNASMAINDTMKIAIMFSQTDEEKTKANKEAEEVCDARAEAKGTPEEKKNKTYDHLCDFFNDTTSDIVETDNKSGPVDVGLTAPDGGNENAKIRDAWIQGGSEILKTVLGGLMPRQNPPPIQNPYPYNYAPFNNGNPPLGIADSILFNARHHGSYGLYMPTPGHTPGTAFPASTSAYTPIGSMSGSFFGR